jgi:hypothetical protein
MLLCTPGTALFTPRHGLKEGGPGGGLSPWVYKLLGDKVLYGGPYLYDLNVELSSFFFFFCLESRVLVIPCSAVWVGTVNSLQACCPWNHGRGKRYICSPKRPNRSGACITLYSLGTSGSFPRAKATWVRRRPFISVWVKNEWCFTSTPPCAFLAWAGTTLLLPWFENQRSIDFKWPSYHSRCSDYGTC